MKVEIWSDIMCPFCYIGKRNQAEMPVKQSVYQYLAEKKGMTLAQSEKMHLNLMQTAKKAGLD